ncbi:septum formation family protein [Amycolatopsis azurea]|uniref:Putative membrane protein n=1 Tax=Amycolatopsis azurea DSM 43854 TaxID=1238180 RepID=M2QU84_9PSEU|nr:septum formation family protein [Amycolatopsis azurea]EMD30066.1 Putative membrane protein [Amycolatopsis azurea DSM 43854]OOC07240.1 hypothetical protein B0293_09365 [Amycolatopsis azurea DSM 43854]
MSQQAERFRDPRNALSTLRTRLVMAGVFVGAIIALSLSVAFSWNVGPEGGAGGGAPKLSPAAVEAFQSPPGTCLTWSNPDANDAKRVSCAEPHLFEVTSIVDIGAQYPAGVPSPSLEQWQEISRSRCTVDVKPYLGRTLDPYGKLSMNLLRPTPAQWEDGDRQLRCGLQWAGQGGKLQPTKGAAKEQDQSAVWEPGTCLALLNNSFGDPIDCAQPHSYEMIATIDLKTKFKDGYPSQEQQNTWLDTECSTAAQEYTGNADLAAKKLILSWDVREQESWDAGSTLVNCKVAAVLPENKGLAPVTGSVKVGNGGGNGDAPPSDGGGPPASSSAPKTGG